MRLAVGDDRVRSRWASDIGQAVEARGKLSEIRGAGYQKSACGFGVRPAVPRAIGVEEEGSQVAPACEAENMVGRAACNYGSGLMQRGDHVQCQAAKPRIGVGAERVAVTGKEREN